MLKTTNKVLEKQIEDIKKEQEEKKFAEMEFIEAVKLILEGGQLEVELTDPEFNVVAEKLKESLKTAESDEVSTREASVSSEKCSSSSGSSSESAETNSTTFTAS